MAMYTPAELRRKWSQGELTSDQLLGQLVQYLIEHVERLAELEKRVRQLEQSPAKPHA